MIELLEVVKLMQELKERVDSLEEVKMKTDKLEERLTINEILLFLFCIALIVIVAVKWLKNIAIRFKILS